MSLVKKVKAERVINCGERFLSTCIYKALKVDDASFRDSSIVTVRKGYCVKIEASCWGINPLGRLRSLINDVLLCMAPVEDINEKFK